jgi:PQQ-like domain
MLGNARMVGTWPARGGPVVVGGKVFFAAGIWPFMGTFIYALDAATGEIAWANRTTGSEDAANPHGAGGVGGPAPQGYLTVVGNALIVPSGRARAGHLDLETGESLPYNMGWKGGNWFLAGNDRVYCNGAYVFDGATGSLGYNLRSGGGPAWGMRVVVGDNTAYVAEGGTLRAYDLDGVHIPINKSRGYEYKQFAKRIPSTTMDASIETVWLRAGSRLYGSEGNRIKAIDPANGKTTWSGEVQGTVGAMAAARGQLYVSTRQGRLYCFGIAGAGTVLEDEPDDTVADGATEVAADILRKTGATKGYCLVAGLTDGRLVEELARQSELHVVGLESDAARVERIRRRLDATGLYGKRLSVIVGDPASYDLAPYFAGLIVSEKPGALGSALGNLLPSLRPYGGVLCTTDKLSIPDAENFRTEKVGDLALLTREGKLPGAAYWTHQYGDAANTMAPQDELVRAPLGMLWYGGPADAKDLFFDRHSGAPRPQVAGGRVVVMYYEKLSAIDVYTGRVLWSRQMPGVGHPYGRAWEDVCYQPNAGLVLGTEYITLPDAIYVRAGEKCLCLDPENGETVREFELPGGGTWGYLAVWKDYLIGGELIAFQDPEDAKKPAHKRALAIGKHNWNAACSANLVVMDRHTGQVHWNAAASKGFRHGATAAGNGRLYTIDQLPQSVVDRLNRRGLSPSAPRLMALDIKTGSEIWSTDENVTGTWLGYSEEHDILIQAQDFTMKPWKTAEVTAHQGRSGRVIWTLAEKTQKGYVISGDTIVFQHARDLRTGKTLGWHWTKNRGCGPFQGSKYLLTYRSSSSGYYDMEHRKGPIHLSGFRPNCSGSLIVGDGVLNAPMYAKGCDCNFPIQTSLGLIYMPELAKWNPMWRH